MHHAVNSPLPPVHADLNAPSGRAKLESDRRDFETALQSGRRAPDTLARLASTCAQLGDWAAAEIHWREVLRLRPGVAVAQTGLGIALRESGRTEEALREFEQAVQAHPAEPAVHFNLGTCFLESDRVREAAAAFRAALRLSPAYAEARFNLALALLKAGVFRNGALAYEARWKAEWKGKERPFEGPHWNGRALAPGQSLLLWGEQGIGDEIMFAGLLGAAVSAAGAPVLLECAPRLVPLFARSFPEVNTVARQNPPVSLISPQSIHAPVGSLPGLLWPADSPPEPAAPYLHADPTVVAQLRARLSGLGRGPKIGVAWRGGHPAAGRPRLIPAPAWAELLSRPGIVAISLQHGTTPEDLTAFSAVAGSPLHQLPDIDPLADMDAFAALVAACDAVISVDNSTVHLAGALGVPTAVLLAQGCDWRWGVDGVPCPWYRTVVRLRQKVSGDWSHPMQLASAFIASLPISR